MRLIIILLLCGTFSFGQNSFPTKYEITKDGFTDFTVISVEGKTKEEIYKKTIEWISKTYNSPKDVIKAEVENDYIRFQGVQTGVQFSHSFIGPYVQDIRYQIEISVKDNKFKFDVLEVERFFKETQYAVGDWVKIIYNTEHKGIFNSKGKQTVDFKDIDNVPKVFNNLQDSLKKYIETSETSTTKSEW